jgi:hypothetical protein
VVSKPDAISGLFACNVRVLVLERWSTILLDDKPPLVVQSGKRLQHAGDVDIPLAERYADICPPDVEVSSLLGAGGQQDFNAHILDVHMVDSVSPIPNALHRIRASEGHVSHVEREMYVGALEEDFDLPGGFNVG